MDADRYEWVSRWNWFAQYVPNSHGYYVARKERTRTVLLHRQLLGEPDASWTTEMAPRSIVELITYVLVHTHRIMRTTDYMPEISLDIRVLIGTQQHANGERGYR